MERKWFYKGNKNLVGNAIILAMATGSNQGTFVEYAMENGEVVTKAECTVCRAGFHDTTYTEYVTVEF